MNFNEIYDLGGISPGEVKAVLNNSGISWILKESAVSELLPQKYQEQHSLETSYGFVVSFIWDLFLLTLCICFLQIRVLFFINDHSYINIIVFFLRSETT